MTCWSARGGAAEAADAFTAAAALTGNGPERTLLLGRAERARSLS